MLLGLIIYVLVLGSSFASFLAPCSFAAVWLALGRTPVVLRMPIFLLCTLALGILPVLWTASSISASLFYYVFGVVLVAASFVRIHALAKMLTLAWGALMLLAVPNGIDPASLDSSWIVRVAIAMTLIALPLAIARLAGLRLINLTDGIQDLEMERGTGRDLRQWFAFLDAEHAESLKHAEIMAILRGFGFSFAWQKTITVAYERTLGRWDVEPIPHGKSRIVATTDKTHIADFLTKSTNQQFSIWQLMQLTFCAACLFGFVRNFSWPALTLQDYKYVIPATIGVAANTINGLYIGLSIRRSRRRILAAGGVAIAIAAGVSRLMGFGAISPFASVAFTALLLHAFLVAAVLDNLRYHGFRLVFVRIEPKRS
jgi:hypothetical protein